MMQNFKMFFKKYVLKCMMIQIFNSTLFELFDLKNVYN
jgi:hypothetical protein